VERDIFPIVYLSAMNELFL